MNPSKASKENSAQTAANTIQAYVETADHPEIQNKLHADRRPGT
jgi:hypothetical protein